jgi:hypothetical protein
MRIRMSEFVSALLAASRWLRDEAVTLAIVAGGMGLLTGCVYRFAAHPEWSAREAMEILWPLYLAGALSLLLGWLMEQEAA